MFRSALISSFVVPSASDLFNKISFTFCLELKFISPLILIYTSLWNSKSNWFPSSPSTIFSFKVIASNSQSFQPEWLYFCSLFCYITQYPFYLPCSISFLLCKFVYFSFLPLSVSAVTCHHVWSMIQISPVKSRSSRILTDVHHIPANDIPQSMNGRNSRSVQKPAYLKVVSALNDLKAACSIAA